MSDQSQNPYDLRRVPNCESLTVYRIPRSRFWHYRFRLLKAGRYKRGSTETENATEAVQRAKQYWLDHVAARDKAVPPDKRIEVFTARLQTEQEKQVSRGHRSERFAVMDRHRLTAIQQFFKDNAVDAIDGQRILAFQDFLYQRNPDISKQTLRHYYVVLRKVLKNAALTGAVKVLPPFPAVGGTSGINPRTGFTTEEYKTLRDHLEAKSADDPRYNEVYDMILFMVNSLLRPAEVKQLTHRHIRTEGSGQKTTIYVRPPNPKVKAYDYETFTMPGAVGAYLRMRKRYADPDSHIFFADIADRNYALRLLGDLFSDALVELNIKQTAHGRRTLYSLRHSGISWRLERSEGSIFDIARWARTSVQMIEKFYASAYSLNAVAPQLLATKKTSTRTVRKKKAVK
jgi:integrase